MGDSGNVVGRVENSALCVSANDALMTEACGPLYGISPTALQ